MEPSTTLQWVKDIGSLLISWPTVVIVALLMFKRHITKILDQLSESKLSSAKVGPVEFVVREIDKLSSEVEVQKNEQVRQKAEIDILKFLIKNFLTQDELTHLRKLHNSEPFIYEKTQFFESELRRLRSLGLISNIPNKGIRTMPQHGNLRDYFTITDQGREYLTLRGIS